jgi:hypothetical protein
MFSLIAVLLWASTLTGCVIGEDLSDCMTDDNLVIEFRFEASVGSATRLTDKISSVDILLFDSDGRFVDSRRLERDELAASPYASFTVWTGDYLVTAWANAGTSTRISTLEKGISLLTEGYIEMTEAGDSLYYAPSIDNLYTDREAALRADEADTETDPYAMHRVHVPYGGGRVVKELPFTRAYRKVNVYFKGVEYLRADAGASPLSVSGVNLSARYDLMFNSLIPASRSYTRLCSEVQTSMGRMQATHFMMSYAPITNDIVFRAGNLPADVAPISVALADYLRANPTVNLDDIDILIEFSAPEPGGSGKRVEVTITAPDWASEPVEPVY